MTYCVTPGCLAPQNPDSARFCQSCGAKLWLKERYRAILPIGRGGFGRLLGVAGFLVTRETSERSPR